MEGDIATSAAAKGTVCVTGAAGFIGSWLVMRLLERGYVVRATVRDPGHNISANLLHAHVYVVLLQLTRVAYLVFTCLPGNMKKVKHLLDLPKASTHLTLWKADMTEEGSFDEATQGCEGVFHVATPMDFDSKDPEVCVHIYMCVFITQRVKQNMPPLFWVEVATI